ncbi:MULTISPECIES: helix-turn-helix transcriptional regulator [unclassified Cellulomonas]|nr:MULTISPECIES: helix-turn-helix domain-containing protein [unclassified Cellulomonas]MCR6705673.1 helix-turn-helix domain-containing protein [Cellulomonas sp.]
MTLLQRHGTVTRMERTLPARSLTRLGSAVRRLRNDRGLTQAQLAEAADVSRAWLIDVERGDRPGLELARLLRVLDALDASLMIRDDLGEQE